MKNFIKSFLSLIGFKNQVVLSASAKREIMKKYMRAQLLEMHKRVDWSLYPKSYEDLLKKRKLD